MELLSLLPFVSPWYISKSLPDASGSSHSFGCPCRLPESLPSSARRACVSPSALPSCQKTLCSFRLSRHLPFLPCLLLLGHRVFRFPCKNVLKDGSRLAQSGVAPSLCRGLGCLTVALRLSYFLLDHRSPFHLERLPFLAHCVHQTPQTILSEI